MIYVCKHGAERKQTGRNRRPHQHSVKFGCKSYVRFYKRASGEIALTSFSEDHDTQYPSHISEEIFRRDTDTNKVGEEEENLVQTLMDANCRAGQIKKMLESKKHLKLTTSAVSYRMKKLKGDDHYDEELTAFLTEVEEEGGHVHKLVNGDGTVRVLTITTSQMRQAFLKSKPTVIQVDSTFNFETSGYKLSCIVYLNPVTGKGEVAQLAFLEDEGEEAYKFTFSMFKKTILNQNPGVIIVDKDFTELKVLKSIFETSNVILCRFHVLKWIRNLINTAVVDQDQKSEMMERFRDMLYAHSHEIFCSQLKVWLTVIKGVEIRVGAGVKSHYVSLENYYQKNWGGCTEMWADYLRRKLPGIGEEFTNNRVERTFGSMKQFLRLYTSGEVTIYKAIMHLTRWAEEKLTVSYTAALRHRVQIFDHDPAVRELYKEAAVVLNDSGCMLFKLSFEKLKELKGNMKIVPNGVEEKHGKPLEYEEDDEEWEDMEKFDDNKSTTYKCDEKSCSCSFWIRHMCPCRHVLFVRDQHSLTIFDKNLFSSKYDFKRKEDLTIQEGSGDVEDSRFNHDESCCEDEEVDLEEFTVYSREEKYKRVHPVIERITEILLHFGTEQIEHYVSELEKVEENIRLGRKIFSTVSTRSNMSECLSTLADKVEENEKGEDPRSEGHGSSEKTGTDNELKSKDKLKFKAKVKRRGRPKGAGSKVRFFKILKTKVSQVKKVNQTLLKAKQINSRKSVIVSDRNIPSPSKFIKDLKSKKMRKVRSKIKAEFNHKKVMSDEVNVLSDTEEPKPSPNPPNPIVCYFPGYAGKRRSVHNADYSSLEPGRYLTDMSVDFAFRYEEIFREPEEVWLLSTEFAQILGGGNWWEDARMEKSLENSKLWQEDGAKIVLLPVCHSSHFYGLAAILDPAQPTLVILESLGGNYAIEPPVASSFKQFLTEQKQLLDGSIVEFKTLIPSVPRQTFRSNNCGLFLIEFMRKIVEKPREFIDKATRNSLADWFPHQLVASLRSEIATLMILMGEEQRNPLGVLAGQSMDLPDIGMAQVGFHQQDYNKFKLSFLF